MEKTLSVYFRRALAGTLTCASDGLSFEYARQWLANRAFIPLSVTLPRAARRFEHRIAYPYFENLLPEAELRTTVAQARGVANDDVFELLEKFGGDCVGAVSFALPGTVPAWNAEYCEMRPRKIAALIADCEKIPLMADDPGRRATLAGSAQKTSVCVRRGKIYAGRANAPTTHVLKPDSSTLPQSPANEAFCMALAARVGLPVAKAALIDRGGRLLLVPRADRALVNGRVKRLHQIDFCQAGNFESEKKYEKDGGPGMAHVFGIAARYLPKWPRERPALIRWVLFNYLSGNCDTHAKNLSLSLTRGGVRLTAFYDLLSTAIYPKGEKELSLKIGGEKRSDAVGAREWRQFAREVRIEWPALEKMGREMAAALPQEAQAAAAKINFNAAEKRRIEAVMRFLTARARTLEKVLA